MQHCAGFISAESLYMCKCNTVPVQPYALLKMNVSNIWYGALHAA